jgi:hypothetical protein
VHLARFSRDVGFHCTPTGIPAGLKGRPTVAPHISRKTSEIPEFPVRGTIQRVVCGFH